MCREGGILHEIISPLTLGRLASGLPLIAIGEQRFHLLCLFLSRCHIKRRVPTLKTVYF